MAVFGNAAVDAVHIIQNGKAKCPINAWHIAIGNMPVAESTKEKGCPKNTFLGLCEDGYFAGIGIPCGNYINSTKDKKNKEYGIQGVKLLRRYPEMALNKSKLWRKVLEELNENPKKTPESQMDVVVTLWENDLLGK
jgi:hypothetical protein